jgi:hypothetical protein
VGSTLKSRLDRFFEIYYRAHPVDATFIGNHDYDSELPDVSESGVERLLAEAQSLAEELEPDGDDELSLFETIDARLARGALEIKNWELTSGHFHRRNPAWYTGEAVFSIVSLLLRDFAPLEERLRSVRARMLAVPGLLDQARRNLSEAPLPWTERAIRECEGALSLLDEGLRHVPGAERLEAPVGRARSAFLEYRAHLEESCLANPGERYACGEEAFDGLLRHGHFLEWSAREIAERALDELKHSETELASGARRLGVADVRDALALLEEIRPSREDYYERYRTLWEESRTFAETHRLVTWPDYPVDYRPQPLWARKAAPKLYFLFYRSPAPLDALSRVEYLVTPIEPELDDLETERLLRANNDSVIKLNHVVHHGGIGHHVQNWNAFRSESRIGRIAAVDGSSRIALFCGGTMAEGWASYATDLMDESGFLTPLESYTEHYAHARMAARAIVDVELHLGEMTFEEACRFYREHTLMSEAAARAEVTKNSMFPAAAIIYFVGSQLIRDLRRKSERRLGKGFDLRRFHDELLSFGSIPVALIARAMKQT